MSGIKLTYFDLRGRGELPRLLLTVAGKKFEDNRVTQEQWKTEKAKAKFNVMPNLLYKGKVYGQSMAIAQFLAREFGLYGKDNEEALRVDEVLQLMVDVKQATLKPVFISDAAQKEAEIKNAKESTTPSLKHLEALAVSNGKTGYFVGKKLSVADIMFFDCWHFIKMFIPEVETGSEFAELRKIIANVGANSAIKAYIAKRKETPF